VSFLQNAKNKNTGKNTRLSGIDNTPRASFLESDFFNSSAGACAAFIAAFVIVSFTLRQEFNKDTAPEVNADQISPKPDRKNRGLSSSHQRQEIAEP
jgi:hypothetical protein